MKENLEELKMELEKNVEEYKRMVGLQEQFIQSAGLQQAFQEFLRSRQEDAVHKEEPETSTMETYGEMDATKEPGPSQEDLEEPRQAGHKHVKKAKSL